MNYKKNLLLLFGYFIFLILYVKAIGNSFEIGTYMFYFHSIFSSLILIMSLILLPDNKMISCECYHYDTFQNYLREKIILFLGNNSFLQIGILMINIGVTLLFHGTLDGGIYYSIQFFIVSSMIGVFALLHIFLKQYTAIKYSLFVVSVLFCEFAKSMNGGFMNLFKYIAIQGDVRSIIPFYLAWIVLLLIDYRLIKKNYEL